jgi:hypothetical protein
MSIPVEYLRFKRNPQAEKPPGNYVDIFYDPVTDNFKFRRATGADVALGSDVDADGNLVVNGIVLADTGAVAQTENSIGRNSTGGLFLHDGVTDGEDLPALRPTHRIREATVVTQTEARAGYIKRLGGFHLPVAKAVAGTRWRVSGSYLESHATTVGAKAAAFGFCPDGAASQGFGVGPNVAIADNLLHVALPHFSMEMELQDIGGGLYLLAPVSATGYVGPVFYSATDGTAALLTMAATGSAASEGGSVGVATEIGLYVSAPAGTNATLIEFTVDITIEEIQ